MSSGSRVHGPTYTVWVRNITLSVDEAVIRTVRLYAAARGSTVNALVREFSRQPCGARGPGPSGAAANPRAERAVGRPHRLAFVDPRGPA